MLNQDAMTPLYVQLMEEVEKSIRSGEYKPGDRLMTEAEMAKKYGVSLITVRKAIGSRNMKKLQSFTEMCTQMGVKPGARMLENRLIPADRKTAESLGVEAGSSVIYISRLRYADQEPVQIEKSYFPLKYAFLLEAKFDDNSLFDYLREKTGMKVTGSEKIIELCRAMPEEAALLAVKKGDYLLFVRSTAYDRDGEPVYAGVQVINGDRFALRVYESDGE